MPPIDASPPTDARLRALAEAWRAGGAGERPAAECLAQLEADLAERYARAGMPRPEVIRFSGPAEYCAAVADPGERLRPAGRPAPRPAVHAVRRAAARAARTVAWVVLLPAGIVAVALTAGLLAGLSIGLAVGAYRLVLLALGGLGVRVGIDSVAGNGLFAVAMVAGLAGFVALLLRTLGWVVVPVLRVVTWRPPHWSDDVSRLIASDVESLAVQGITATLREVMAVLAPPVGLTVDDLDGHEVLEVRWADGAHHVFVDGERVPIRPAPGEAGRQGELFARRWVDRHLGPAPVDQIRAEAERGVQDCYRALGLPVPPVRWCAAPQEYEQVVAQLWRVPGAGSARQSSSWLPFRGRRIREGGAMHVLDGLWEAVRDDLRQADTVREETVDRLVGVVGESLRSWQPWRTHRVLAVGTAAQWRWARTIQASGDGAGSVGADGAESVGADLLTALERTERVAWVGTPHAAVLLAPPLLVEPGAPSGVDGQAPAVVVTWSDGSQWQLLDGVRLPDPGFPR